MKIHVKLAFQKADFGNKKPNIYERLIRWWTKSKYYHVELIIGNRWISSIDTIGFRVKNLNKLRDNYDYHDMELVVSKQTIDKLWDWIDSQTGKKYDWYGLVMSQIFKLGLDNKDKTICSEAVTIMLQILEVEEVMTLKPITVSPGDLAKIFKVEQ